jgi:hypothetical protein
MVEILRKPSHMKRWTQIMRGGHADWQTLFDGYQSAVDWPVAAYYRELMDIYPEAKIILTVRDPGSWHRSIMTTFYQARRAFVVRATQLIPTLHQFLTAMETALWHGIFHNKLEDKAHATGIFKTHIQEVQRVVPHERLLIFEARQGWEPLCSFLHVPVPSDKPYPHKHNGTLMRRFLQSTNLTDYR